MGKHTNNTGRKTGKLDHNQIEGQFIAYTLDMLESPAMAVLTGVDRRVLDRLCIEHMAHAGSENGNLKCTYTDFQKFGIRRAAIGDSIRRLSALGFIEIILSGGKNKAEYHYPSIYRLTFAMGNLAPTSDWKSVSDIATAKAIISRVSTSRKQQVEATKKRAAKKSLEVKKQKAGRDNVSKAGRDNAPIADTKTYPQKPDAITYPPYISWRGGPTTTELAAAGVPTQGAKPVDAISKVVPFDKNKKTEIKPIAEITGGILDKVKADSRIASLFSNGPIEEVAQ